MQQGWGFDGFMVHERNEKLLQEVRASHLGKQARREHRSSFRRLFETLGRGRESSGVEVTVG